ncbi:MAG: CIA30 family protein [Planctomycetota bacterium]
MRLSISTPSMLLAAALSTPSLVSAQDFQLNFDNGVGSWSTVLDGVMGGLSTGRVSQPEPGMLRFTGDLSLENNGGFSQMRTAVQEGSLAGADGLVLDVKGDGRTYKFNLRVSNVRMMAGGFETDFETKAGEWTRVQLPFEAFELFTFGRRVRRAPELEPKKIESLGVTLADKKPGSFALEIRSIRAYSGTAGDGGSAARGAGDSNGGAAAAASGKDLVSVAKAAGLDTLLAAVTAAGLELPKEPVTILAPTDEAFAALPKGTLAALLKPENKDQLKTILLHHVVAGSNSSADVLNRRALTSLANQQLAIDFAAQTIAGAGLIATDVAFDGGTVHVVDKVLIPETRSIAQVAVQSKQLRTLVAAVKATRVDRQLDDNGPWTVFAPVDSAFAKLPEGVVADLLKRSNRNKLTSILGLHVVPGRITAGELLQKRQFTTLLGAPIEAKLINRKLTVGGASLVQADIEAKNGIVHLIDSVITAPAGGGDMGSDGRDEARIAGRSSEGSTINANQELFRIYDLAVERGAPLFNEGQHGACAAVYEIAAASLLRLGRGQLANELIEELRSDCENAAEIANARSRAWAFRRALDQAYRTAEKTSPKTAEKASDRGGLRSRR